MKKYLVFNTKGGKPFKELKENKELIRLNIRVNSYNYY